MPSTYAHLRFGQEALSRIPGKNGRLAGRFRQLYDVGLQGPDPFFYYSPLIHTATGHLGKKLHAQSGIEFFGNALDRLRAQPTDAGIAYLYGLLGHYCLDSLTHPLVHSITGDGNIGHTELETEFDRFLLQKDGKLPAHAQRLDRRLRLTPGECATAAGLLEDVAPMALSRSLRNMTFLVRLAASRNRRTARLLLGLGGRTGRELVMTVGPNPNCAQFNEAMLACFDQALERFPELACQLESATETGEPLGEDFAACFG